MKGDESGDLLEKNVIARENRKEGFTFRNRSMMGPLGIENALMSMVGT